MSDQRHGILGLHPRLVHGLRHKARAVGIAPLGGAGAHQFGVLDPTERRILLAVGAGDCHEPRLRTVLPAVLRDGDRAVGEPVVAGAVGLSESAQVVQRILDAACPAHGHVGAVHLPHAQRRALHHAAHMAQER